MKKYKVFLKNNQVEVSFGRNRKEAIKYLVDTGINKKYIRAICLDADCLKRMYKVV